MEKQRGHFVDDARLHPRDNSGPGLDRGGEFGASGKVPAQPPANPEPGAGKMKTPMRRVGGGY